MYAKIQHRLTLILHNHLLRYPSPINLSYFWNYGFIAFIFLFLQLITGIFLAMHYCSNTLLAFSSVEHIMRDVAFGWFIRYAHANGASFFFVIVYLHIARGLYYLRFDYLNLGVWITGLLIFFLMIISAFIGYVLPWGQMSFWGATVITNLVSVLPYIGNSMVLWLWGGFSVDSPTLSRFFSLHFVFPLLVFGITLLHFYFLHIKGSSNPSIISPQINRGYLPLYPYFIIKDWVGFSLFLLIFFVFVCFWPDFLGHSDNYIEANPMATPEHIVPEWYFLPFYAILRSISDKVLGVVAMGSSILIFFFLPIFSYISYSYSYFWNSSFSWSSYSSPILWWSFFNVFILLGWIGSKPVDEPFATIGFFLLICFFFFIILNSGVFKACYFRLIKFYG